MLNWHESVQIRGNRKQNKGFQNKTWETGSKTKDFRTKQRISEQNGGGNRKRNKGFQNKTWETESETKDFRSKSGKQKAKQRISEQNLGIRNTKPGETGSKTTDFVTKQWNQEAAGRKRKVRHGKPTQEAKETRTATMVLKSVLLFSFALRLISTIRTDQ